MIGSSYRREPIVESIRSSINNNDSREYILKNGEIKIETQIDYKDFYGTYYKTTIHNINERIVFSQSNKEEVWTKIIKIEENLNGLSQP